MSIIFAGNSGADFRFGLETPGSKPDVSTRAPYVSESIALLSNQFVKTPHFTPMSELWVSAYVHFASTVAGTLPILQFLDESGNVLFDVAIPISSTFPMALRAFDGDAMSSLVTGAVELKTSILYRLDIHLKVDSSDGEFTLYINGLEYASFTGNTELIESPLVSAIQLRPLYTGTSSYGSTCWSAIIVADEDTRLMKLVQSTLTGAGSNSDWDGTYQDIDERGFDDLDYISAEVADSVSTFKKKSLPSELSDTHDVVAVVISGRGYRKENSDVKAAIHTGGNTYEVGSLSFGEDLGSGQVVLHADPATEQAWTFEDADAAEIGVKLKAVA